METRDNSFNQLPWHSEKGYRAKAHLIRHLKMKKKRKEKKNTKQKNKEILNLALVVKSPK